MLDSILCSLGHVATWKVLASHSISRHALRTAVLDGQIIRPRRGVYACAHIDASVQRAAEIGGAVSCISALSRAGVWSGFDRRLHVHVPPHGSMTAPPGIVLHWEALRFGTASEFRLPRMQVLWEAMACMEEEQAIAALESAVHEGYATETEIRRLALHAPRRMTDGIRRLDFRSQSGNETIVRLRLQRVGYRVEPQAAVPGVGHEDLLVEDCVGLDVDGRRWHGEDRFAIDRERDIRVESLGRRALRIWAGQIYDSWPTTLAAIDRAVLDARREQDRRRGRVVVAFGAQVL